MRPSPDVPDGVLLECLECGTRDDSSSGRTCEACGGPLQNLAVERDL